MVPRIRGGAGEPHRPSVEHWLHWGRCVLGEVVKEQEMPAVCLLLCQLLPSTPGMDVPELALSTEEFPELQGSRVSMLSQAVSTQLCISSALFFCLALTDLRLGDVQFLVLGWEHLALTNPPRIQIPARHPCGHRTQSPLQHTWTSASCSASLLYTCGGHNILGEGWALKC